MPGPGWASGLFPAVLPLLHGAAARRLRSLALTSPLCLRGPERGALRGFLHAPPFSKLTGRPLGYCRILRPTAACAACPACFALPDVQYSICTTECMPYEIGNDSPRRGRRKRRLSISEGTFK